MKSKKVVLSLLIVILLSKLTWGTPLYTVMHKMDDVGINIVCRDGNIVIESSTKGEEIYIEYVKGNTSYYYLDNKKEWQSRRISEIRKTETEENTTQEKFFKITKTDNVPINLINKTTQMKLPYSSDIGQDLTKGFMIVNHRNITVYIQPEFDFYNYDKNKMGTGANVIKRQQNVIKELKKEIASTNQNEKETAESARKQLNIILAESIINSSIQEDNICELVSQKETGKADRKYKVYAPGNLEVNANEYLRNYIKEGPYKANAPVFSSDLYSNKYESLENYRSVGKDANGKNNQEGELLAAAARRYLNWAVEYAFNTQNIKNKKKIYDTVDNIWEKNSGLQTNNYYSGNFPVESDSEDNPIPYVKGGFDTPRTFWRKMHFQHNSNQFMSADNYLFDTYWYDSSSYLPGVGIEKDINGLFKLKYAGCDSMGMLCGIIEMSGLNQFVPNIEGKNPATELDNYTRSFDSYIKESPEDNSFDTEKYKSIRYTIPDLEKITTVVPSYDEIQLGDLLIKIGAKETDIAVVIDIGNKTKESIQVVYMKREKYGTTKKDFWANLDFSDSYTVRRLLVKKENAAVPAEKYKDAEWDILRKQVDLTKSSISIGTKMEQGQNQQNDKNWRFIPNTGEYLILGELTVDLVNSAGVQLNEIYDKEYMVKQLYVKDRSFKDAEGRDANNNILTDKGNIYINRADKIEMAYFEEGKTKVFGKSIFKVTREKNGNDKSEYYKSRVLNKNDIQAGIDSRGKIINTKQYNTTSLSIGIRPESAEHAYPGDDYILGLEVSDGNNSYKVECDQKDYVAVYDKKMLWRANLYIDEREEDWNNEHTWNTPPAGDKIAGTWADSNSKSYLANWNASDWGYNQWNRKYELCTDFNVTDFTQLKVGDGKQVVKFSSWSPVRNQRDINNSEFNLKNNLTDRVSYDYPDKDKKINAWDSPFDFLWKLNEQKKAIKKQFTNEVQTINNDLTLTQQQKNDKLNAGGKFPRGNNNTESDKFTSSVSVKSLSEWNVTNAPDNRWRYYWKKTVTGNNDNQKAYVPGLGLFHYRPNHDYNDVKNNTNENITISENYSSGTDCIGLVQRAAGYQNISGSDFNSGRIYKWPQIGKDKAENPDINLDTESRWKSNGDYKTEQPDNTDIIGRLGTYTKQFIFTSDLYKGCNGTDLQKYTYMTLKVASSTTAPTKITFEEIRKKILLIVPGDIIQYGGEHIGMIASIDYNSVEEAQTMIDLMKAVNVIECVYNSRVNYVIKRNIIQGGTYCNDETETGSWLRKDTTNLRNFTIDRLLFN